MALFAALRWARCMKLRRLLRRLAKYCRTCCSVHFACTCSYCLMTPTQCLNSVHMVPIQLICIALTTLYEAAQVAASICQARPNLLLDMLCLQCHTLSDVTKQTPGLHVDDTALSLLHRLLHPVANHCCTCCSVHVTCSHKDCQVIPTNA